MTLRGHKEIAAMVGITHQAVKKRLEGVEPAEKVRGRGGERFLYSEEQLAAYWPRHFGGKAGPSPAPTERLGMTSSENDSSRRADPALGGVNPLPADCPAAKPTPDSAGNNGRHSAYPEPAPNSQGDGRKTPTALAPYFPAQLSGAGLDIEEGASKEALERVGQMTLLKRRPLPPRNVNPAEWEAAWEKYDAIEPVLNGDYRKSPYRRKDDFLRFRAREAGLSSGTLWRWRRAFLKAGGATDAKRGVLALLRKERKDKGPRRELSDEEKKEVRANRLAGLSARACWKELKRSAAKRGRQAIPSLQMVRRYVRAIPASDLTRALVGRKAYVLNELPYIRLKHDDYRPMELVTLDHTQLDNPVNYFGRACFPFLTLILDWHSRYPLGFWLAETPSGNTIAMATRFAWLFFGQFDEALLDWGQDMRCYYIAGGEVRRRRQPRPFWQPSEGRPAGLEQRRWQGILHSGGCRRVRYTLGDHPQTKGCIERFFRTLKDQFCARFPAYRGRGGVKRGPYARGEAVDELLIEHKRNPQASPLMDVQTYARLLFRYFYEEYAQEEHTGQGMRGRTPAEAFEPRAPLLAGPTDLLLMKRQARIVERGGVRIHGERYESYDLVAHKKHPVDVAYDPYGHVLPDLSEVIVYCQQCENAPGIRAYCARPLSMRGVDEAEMKRRLAERARFLKARTMLIAQAYRDGAHADPLRRRLQALSEPATAGPKTSDDAPVSPPDARWRHTDQELRAEAERIEAAPLSGEAAEELPEGGAEPDYRFFPASGGE